MDDSNDDEDPVRMVESLNQLGVDLLDAQTYVDSISNVPGTFVEVYGRGGICNEARRLRNVNLTGLAAMNLCTDKPDGSPWDCCKRSDRELARSRTHVKLMCEIYRDRHRRGKWFLHERPVYAASWDELSTTGSRAGCFAFTAVMPFSSIFNTLE